MTDAVTDADTVDQAPVEPACMSCGSHLAQRWSTPDGPALLCRECATLHGLGCP